MEHRVGDILHPTMRWNPPNRKSNLYGWSAAASSAALVISTGLILFFRETLVSYEQLLFVLLGVTGLAIFAAPIFLVKWFDTKLSRRFRERS